MRFETPLQPAVLIRRYKRFLADVELPGGDVITVHTPNTGSMMGCNEPGSRVWLRDTGNPKRKYRYSWEMVETSEGCIVGINTGLTNNLVKEAVVDGMVQELSGYDRIRSEVRYGRENSRIDLLLENDGSDERCYVEVKNVTACDGEGRAMFPDAVSARGTKHLRELGAMVAEGHRGVIFFCVQRGDAAALRPADEIDRLYGETLREVLAEGVEAIAYQAEVTPEGVWLRTPLPVVT